jgi:hypothetical protein
MADEQRASAGAKIARFPPEVQRLAVIAAKTAWPEHEGNLPAWEYLMYLEIAAAVVAAFVADDPVRMAVAAMLPAFDAWKAKPDGWDWAEQDVLYDRIEDVRAAFAGNGERTGVEGE